MRSTGILKAEILALVIASFLGLGELLVGNGLMQWALATIMVFASCLRLVFIA
ncbi:hypothetical protein [Bartonella bilalgolemii]|uniref:Uncharacterized protein n=1 Tax=Bartonella bilalgolemii TaxID=2942911 RepID=A0ABT0P961_9HYPH|nr:hypothetical protein [Bartonella sp. G70]MCL6229807.1 hypothetical protein [Bartonella sp. G70]